MPRRLFSGRSHTDPTTDQISKPVLVDTDALPRSDLQNLGRVTPRSAGTGAEAQTTTKEWSTLPPSFHDRGHGSNPPSSSGSMRSYPDPQTIGVALGSPSVYAQPPRFGPSTPRPGTANSNHYVQQTYSPPKRKESRWKKIGGLFKAKSAIEKPSRPPFYQVRVNDQELHQQQQDPFRASPEAVSAPPVAQPPWANGYPKGHNCRVIIPEVDDDDERRNVKSSGKHSSSTQHSAESSKQYAPREAPWDFLKEAENANQETPDGNKEPLLDVAIPEVHMERYSVMFGSLLGKGNRSTLLARRSKHLEKLKTKEEERIEPGKNQGLQPPPRRATSPNPAKSPSFTLFPTAQKPPRSPAPQNAQSRPQHLQPLQKSQTAPIRPSSRNHESQPSASSSQFAFPLKDARPPTPSNAWAAERNAYLSPIVSEAPSTSSGGTVKPATKNSESSLQEKQQQQQQEEKTPQTSAQPLRKKKEDEKPTRQEEAMAQLEESTRQLKMLAKSTEKKEISKTHRPSIAEGRVKAHPTIATAMSSQTIALRQNPPSRAPPHPPPSVAVPSVPRERAQTAPSTRARPKTPNSTQFPPRTSSAVAASRAITPPRAVTASPPLSSASAEDLILSNSDHNDSDVQVHVARSVSVTRSISVTKTNAQRTRQQQQQQQQKLKQQKHQQKQHFEQQHCEQQKQPRQMLVPLGAKTEPFRGDERLVERYHSPQTPTLVENLSSGQSSGSGGSPFRRSQNVLIETA